MRIGLIVDGQAEYDSLPHIVRRLETRCTILDPVYADIQPLAPVGQIVRAVKGRVHILASRNVQRALVLIDRESRDACPGEWAQQLEAELQAKYGHLCISEYRVVIKNRTFENWLIGDPQAISSMRKRFKLSQEDLNRITPNKADHLDAQILLGKAVLNGCYDKIEDARRICVAADPLRIASNSRSFRRLLRLLGVQKYTGQSHQA